MKIQVNTDKNIEGSARLERYVTEIVEKGLKHHVDKISRIEVHLSDENAEKKGGDDVKCRIEARLEGSQPVMVESRSDSHEKALNEGVKKLQAKVQNMLGKLKAR